MAPITSIDFNHDGTIMGYLSSYNWNQGAVGKDKTNEKSNIYLHSIDMRQFVYPKGRP